MRKLNNNIAKSTLGIALALSAVSGSAFAQKVTVTVQNATHGSHFTPLLVAAHNTGTHLFQSGSAASASLQAMAEGGDIGGLMNDLAATTAIQIANPAGGLLAPGHSTTTTVINTDGTDNNYLSVVAMVLPSNDAFIGVNSWHIPTAPGTYRMPILAYDAGTEANDELLGLPDAGAPGNPGMPAAPSGHSGTGGTGAAGTDTNQMIHIHRGILGDTDTEGGPSDLNSSVHRWLNPVAFAAILVEE